jgi:large subunit ribosomal protein L23
MNQTILKGIVLSEKAAYLGGNRVYSFYVSDDANKTQIKKAVQDTYNVTVSSVNTVRTATRREKARGRVRLVRGSKKALVTLPEGQTIDFV